jgi:hypothetical protein
MFTPDAALVGAPQSPATSLEDRLERGDILYYPVCPFPLPEGDDRKFLLEQQLASRAHKNISYDPHTGKTGGFLRRDSAQAKRLGDLLGAFSRSATGWASRTLPAYARAWKLDRVSFRPVEESTRRMRLTARNDLLHVDAFPSRPTNGQRIMRIFANINPTQPRIWATSEPFARLLERFGRDAGLPSVSGPGLWESMCRGVLRLFQPGRPQRSLYDSFMHRFHNYLKANKDFQEKGFKRFWTFPPGSAWVVFTDTCSHAALRGRFALEHSYFVSPSALVLPEESPPAQLERACGFPVLNAAA